VKKKSYSDDTLNAMLPPFQEVLGGGYRASVFGLRSMPHVLPKRNSFTDPYRIDFLPAAMTGTYGQLGLSMHPGRKDLGLSVDWSRDLRADLSLIWQAGVRTIVCMVEEHEFSLLKVPDYIREAETFGFDVIWFPVRDVSTPLSFRLMHKVAYDVWRRLRVGHVLVHCRGGKGRSGTLACCLLELLGWSFSDALKFVRSARPGAVETAAQEAWCEGFKRYLDVLEKRRLGDRA
jgi:protein-tyrosine phosphatase